MNDLKFAVRQLIKHKGSSALAVLILALGIGGTTAVYSVADKVLLHPIPGRDTDRMISVSEVNVTTGFHWHASLPLIRELSACTNLFESVTFCNQGNSTMNARIGGSKVRLSGTRGAPNFFAFFGWMPAAGRTFLKDEGGQTSGDAVVISDGFWRRNFGGKVDTVGSILELDGKPCEIVGIMPPNEYPSFYPGRFDVWIRSTSSGDELPAAWEPEDDAIWNVFARMRPGVSMETVQAFLDTLVAGWMQRVNQPNQRWRFEAHSTRRDIDPGLEKTLWTIQAMIGMLLLIACANVGNLLLSRALSRRGEFGLRMAMGAGRWRIARQMMAESLSLAAIAAVCGVFFAWGGIVMLERFYLGGISEGHPIGMNWRVLALTCGVAGTSGLLFGLAPAWLAARVDINHSLKESAQQHTGGLMQRLFHDSFVIVQVCLSVVLLAGAGMMVHGVVRLLRLDVGMNPKNLYVVVYNPNPVRNAQFKLATTKARGLSERESRGVADRLRSEMRMRWQEMILGRLRAIPGIEIAAADDRLGGNYPCRVEGRNDNVTIGRATVSIRDGNYFETTGAILTAGRWLNDDDCVPGEQTVVINERMAEICWPGVSPLGKRFHHLDDGHSSPTWLADRIVVGVVKNIEYFKWGRDPIPGYYDPFERTTYEKGMGGYFNIGSYIIRSQLNPEALRRSLAKVGSEMSPPVDEIWDLLDVDDQLYSSTAPRRIMMWLTLSMGMLGLVISSLGLYAVMSFAVIRRTREVGIRMAVGAAREQVRNLFLKRGARLIANGLVLGIVVSMTLTQYIGHLVYDVTLFDPWAFGGVVASLMFFAGVACWLPARRAARTDPMEALRNE